MNCLSPYVQYTWCLLLDSGLNQKSRVLRGPKSFSSSLNKTWLVEWARVNYHDEDGELTLRR